MTAKNFYILCNVRRALTRNYFGVGFLHISKTCWQDNIQVVYFPTLLVLTIASPRGSLCVAQLVTPALLSPVVRCVSTSLYQPLLAL